jgi:hypothetical protein
MKILGRLAITVAPAFCTPSHAGADLPPEMRWPVQVCHELTEVVNQHAATEATANLLTLAFSRADVIGMLLMHCPLTPDDRTQLRAVQQNDQAVIAAFVRQAKQR